MRESQFIDQYLALTNSGRLLTPGTFLAYVLRGKAKRYSDVYLRSLMRALRLRGAQAVRSVKGATAYTTVRVYAPVE